MVTGSWLREKGLESKLRMELAGICRDVFDFEKARDYLLEQCKFHMRKFGLMHDSSSERDEGIIL